MADLILHKQFSTLFFGTWKWSKSDLKEPLNFQLDGARSQIQIEHVRPYEMWDLHIPNTLHFRLIIENAPQETISALRSSGSKSTPLAGKIYDYFIETLIKLEGILRVTGNVRHLIVSEAPDIHSFYKEDYLGLHDEEVTWHIDEEKPQPFRPKLPSKQRGRNPLFKHPELVTIEKWKKLQHTINANQFPSNEILELYRLAGRLYPDSKRIPAIEAAILIENKLKSYAEAILQQKGFTKSKIKDLRDELSFNTVLNLVLPLTLKKTELQKVNKWRPKIDRIRKLRNDIAHNNLSEDGINEKEVLNGINAAIDLFKFIDIKMK